MAVTEANKKEYVNLVAEHRMITAIKPQITAFLQGFWELVPKRLISIFNNQEELFEARRRSLPFPPADGPARRST